MSDILIQANDLRRVYHLGKTLLNVLRGVSIEIQRGEFAAIYGHSGSGKSTLLHLLGLLDRPTSGEIIFDGVNMSKTSGSCKNRIRCRDIGFIFQFYHLMPELNVMENVILPAMVDSSTLAWPGKRKAMRCRAEGLLEELGLSERKKHRPKQLSGGERQRVAIARALLHKPKLLLADEPTGNLDSKTGQKIIDVLRRCNKEHGQTIVMVTHDNELASQVDRSLYLQDGAFVD